MANYEAVEASCDGLDNDCDGITDSDIQAKPPLSTGLGVCGGLSMICKGGVWIAPTASTAPDWQAVEQTCDGLDNDCDGQTDEGLVPPLTLPNGALLLSEGVCTGAKPVCVAGSWQAPDYHAFVAGLPSAVTLTFEVVEKTCDGLDNDCDGQTDEGLVAPLAKKQLGVCQGATQVCSGSWGEPNYPEIPGYQLGKEQGCDGLDNDCDGLTDEDASDRRAKTEEILLGCPPQKSVLDRCPPMYCVWGASRTHRCHRAIKDRPSHFGPSRHTQHPRRVQGLRLTPRPPARILPGRSCARRS